jgi:uncharacterized membrane protein YphA (DoxX/SURF4 family)
MQKYKGNDTMTAILNLVRAAFTLASNLDWLALLIARLGVGWIFTPGGWDKLHGLKGLGDWFGTLGIPFPYFNAALTSVVEFVGGLCLIFGLGTRFFSVALSIVMAVALITVGPKSPSFKITEQSVENVKAAGVPNDVLEKLQSIKDQEVTQEEEFLGILKTTIGEEQTVKYKSLILKHAYQSNTQSLSTWLFQSEFILIFVFLLFIVYGPGKVSIDHFIARKYGFSNKRA